MNYKEITEMPVCTSHELDPANMDGTFLLHTSDLHTE